jgi:hypothetical protein
VSKQSDAQMQFDTMVRGWSIVHAASLEHLCERLAPIVARLPKDDPRQATWQTILGMADGEAMRGE